MSKRRDAGRAPAIGAHSIDAGDKPAPVEVVDPIEDPIAPAAVTDPPVEIVRSTPRALVAMSVGLAGHRHEFTEGDEIPEYLTAHLIEGAHFTR